MVGPITGYDPRSAIGPASNYAPQGFTDGYNPPSRNGERTVNAFIDAYEKNNITDGLAGNDWRYGKDVSNSPEQLKMINSAQNYNGSSKSYNQMVSESDVEFPQWASVQVGVVCVAARKRANFYRSTIAAQTAVPVIACAQKLGTFDNHKYRFAGVARTSSMRPHDDGRGPTMDEYFTLTIGGVVQMLNNGNGEINMGDQLEWTFFDDSEDQPVQLPKRKKMGPRVIVIRPARDTSARIFGRALTDGKAGELIDVYVTSSG